MEKRRSLQTNTVLASLYPLFGDQLKHDSVYLTLRIRFRCGEEVAGRNNDLRYENVTRIFFAKISIAQAFHLCLPAVRERGQDRERRP
jgi:hypothetical protein